MLVAGLRHTVLWSTAPSTWNWPWWQYSCVCAELYLSGASKNSRSLSHPKVALEGTRLSVYTQDTQSTILINSPQLKASCQHSTVLTNLITLVLDMLPLWCRSQRKTDAPKAHQETRKLYGARELHMELVEICISSVGS